MNLRSFTLLLLLIVLLSVTKSFGQVPDVEIEEFEEIEMEPMMEVFDYPRNNLGTYYHEGKMGLKSRDSILTQAIYDQVSIVNEAGFVVVIGKAYGFVDKTGAEVLPLKFESISASDGYLKVMKKDYYGLYTIDGRRILPFRYQKIYGANSADQFVIEDKKGNLQLINQKGKTILKGFDRIELFNNGAIYTKNGKFGLLNGNRISGLIYDTLCQPTRYYVKNDKRPRRLQAYQNSGGTLHTLIAEQGDKIGLIDTLNHALIPIEQDDLKYEGMKGYYVVTQGKKKGFYLPRCNVYHKPEFDGVYMDGISYLQVNDGLKRGLYSNITGELILPVEYSHVYYVTRSYIITKDKKKGVINLKGEIIIPIEYKDVDHLGGLFSHQYDDLYKVKLGDSVGVVNANNEKVVPIVYQSLYDFANRFFLVQQNDLFGLVSLDGEVIQSPQYTYIQDGSNRGYKGHICLKDNLFGVLNEHGAIYLNNEFSSFSSIPTASRELELPSRGSKGRYLKFVHESGKNGVMNMALGTLSLPVTYDEVYQSIEHKQYEKTLFVVKRGAKFGLVDATNKEHIAFEYDTLDAFAIPYLSRSSLLREHTLVAKKNGKYGVINLAGEVMVPFEYRYIEKLGVNNLFKAKKQNGYCLINAHNEVLNAGPFVALSQMEEPGFMLAFFDDKMRRVDEQGRYISKAIKMKPHIGFRTFTEEKQALRAALDHPDDSALFHFAEKIAPSDHLMSFLEEDSKLLDSYHSLGRNYIIEKYYSVLLDFKYGTWNSSYFNQNTLEVEDYIGYKYGVVTNKRVSDWAYDDTRILEKILRNSIKINGYWISSYYLRRQF